MNRRKNSDFEELEELLWRAEAALQDPPAETDEEDFSEFLYPESDPDDPSIYRNFANSYGRSHTPQAQQRPSYPAQYYDPDPDYTSEPDDADEPEYCDAPPRKPASAAKPKRPKDAAGAVAAAV